MFRSILLLAALLQGTASLPATGIVEGRIVLANGAPATAMRVALAPAGKMPPAALTRIVLADSDGHFRMENLAPGQYYVLAGDMNWPTYYPGVVDSDKATAVTVAARTTSVPLNFTVDPKLTSGTIEVVVQRAGTSAPIAGATVALMDSLLSSSSQAEAITDNDGRAVLRAVPAGQYVVRVRADSYYWSGQSLQSETVVSPERKEQRIRVELNRAGVISGRILGVDGVPVAGVRVQALSLQHQNGRRTFMNAGSPDSPSTPTGVDGVFRVETTGPGDFYLRAQLDLRRNGNIQTIDSAAPIPGMNNVAIYYPGVSRPDGALPISANPEATGRDFHLTSEPLFTLSGTVEGIASVDIRLIRQDTKITDALLPSIQRPPRRNGAFDVPLVPAGQYNLYLGFSTAETRAYNYARVPITVGPDVRDLKVTVPPLATVRGRMAFRDGANGERPMRVLLERAENISVAGGTPSATASRAAPELTFNNVPQTQYRLLVGTPAEAYVADILQDGTSVMTDGLVIVRPTTFLEVVIAQSSNIFRVSTLRAGTPVAEATVVLVPADPRRANMLLYKRARTDASGIVSLTGVAPGEYELFAFPNLPNGRPEQNAEFMAKYRPRARELTVGENASGTIDIQLEVIDDPALSAPSPR